MKYNKDKYLCLNIFYNFINDTYMSIYKHCLGIKYSDKPVGVDFQ